MQTVALGNTNRHTTRLGFGGSSLMAGLSRKQSLRMLEVAYDAGIRHFDVAPSYGYGAAEECLGAFLRRHRGAVTVTTKYGIPPARNQLLIGAARRLVKPLVELVPGAKARLAKVANTVASGAAKGSFSASEAQASLDSSLRALQTERIDVFLMHEATAADLRDPALLEVLERAVQAGKIGAFGVGSERHRIDGILATCPRFCDILQTEWSVFDPVPENTSFQIHHRSLLRFSMLQAALAANPELTRDWSEESGADLFDTALLRKLMLRASLVMNPASIVLFSSKSSAHVAANAEMVAANATLDAQARKLYALVQLQKNLLSSALSNRAPTSAAGVHAR